MNLAFILYDGRSGSTKLASELNNVYGLHITKESDFPSWILEMNDSLFKENKLAEIYNLLQKEVQFSELNISLEGVRMRLKMSFNNDLSKKNLIKCIVQECFGDFYQDDYYIIKHSPTKHLPTLINLFPDAKFIHIIRDPRAVYASKKEALTLTSNKPFSRNVFGSCKNWLYRMEIYSSIPICKKVLFENFVKNSENQIKEILSFLNINKPFQLKTESEPYFEQIGSKQKGLHVNVAKPLSSNVIDKWKTKLSEYEVWVLERSLSKWLDDFGYAKSVNCKSIKYRIKLFYDQTRYYIEGLKNLAKLFFENKILFREKVNKAFYYFSKK